MRRQAHQVPLHPRSTMSNALAVEARFAVTNYLKTWVESRLLTYKFSVHEDPLQPKRVRVTLSKPTPEMPAPAAVAHLYFHLDDSLQRVLGFSIESEAHFHSLAELRFDEKLVDQVISRKLRLRQERPIRLHDEFSSTRVPAMTKERDDERRDRDRESLEEYLLERFQRKDPYNEGRISFPELKDALYGLEFPAIGRHDREIMFAFVELDRDEMVDYGGLISIGADVIDTLLHAPRLGSREDKSSDDRKESKGSSRSAHAEEEALELFQAAFKHQQFYTIGKLEELLDKLRPPKLAAQETTALEGAASTDAIGGGEQISEDDAPAGELASTAEERDDGPTEQYITKRQLRGCLESPQLLLSKAEVNLVVALATTSPSGQVPCSQLGELLQFVQSMVFQFQCRCFTDRIEHYLLQQFTNFEGSNLKGSAEHLKMRLRQREVKAVVKDMKKLLLTQYQCCRIVALCEETSDVDHIVYYKQQCLPKIMAYLASQVDLHALDETVTTLHALQHEERVLSDIVLPEESTVLQLAAETFESADEKRLGVLSTADFYRSLRAMGDAFAIELEEATDIREVSALADPLGQGRVNYAYAQQLLYPMLHNLVQEKQLKRARERHRGKAVDETRAETKRASGKEETDEK